MSLRRTRIGSLSKALRSLGVNSNPAGGGGAPFDPLSLSPETWLKADALGLADGTAIGGANVWSDSSGNNRTATQATGTKQPLFKTGIQNGLPGVLCDGVDDELAVTLSALTTRTLFLVMKATADTGGRNLYGFSNNATARCRIVAGAGYSWVFDQSSVVQNIGGAVSTTAQLLTMKVVSAASIVFYMNGVQTAAFDPNDFVTTSGALSLGANGGANFFPGYVFEVFSVGSALSDSDRNKMETSLMVKWGL